MSDLSAENLTIVNILSKALKSFYNFWGLACFFSPDLKGLSGFNKLFYLFSLKVFKYKISIRPLRSLGVVVCFYKILGGYFLQYNIKVSLTR